MPLISGDGNADHVHSLNRGILDVPQWVQDPPMPLATNMQGHFSDTSPDKSSPSYDLYSPYQIGEPWDLSLQQDMEDIPLPLFSSNRPLEDTFYASNCPVATRSDSIPTLPDRNTSSSLQEPTKMLELRYIMPKPRSLPSDAGSDTNSGEVTQKGPAKLGRRRRLTADEKKAAARIRQIGSCARCIARKTKVSSRQYSLQQLCVTLIPSVQRESCVLLA